MSRTFTFTGGNTGDWHVMGMRTITGEGLAAADYLTVEHGPPDPSGNAIWQLCGVTSNDRYLTRSEKDALVSEQPPTGRPEATCAALIPIRKNVAWWGLTQDERRDVIEERSHHIKTGRRYLPAVARRLHHCRDLGGREPFDFLTWFEFAPSHAGHFDDLVAALRTTEEWTYVDREVEIRVSRFD